MTKILKIYYQIVLLINILFVILQPKSRKQKHFDYHNTNINNKKTCVDL